MISVEPQAPKQRTSFDAQLWALHRNSLLLSGLLLVLCLPGISVSKDQTLYWLHINGATLPNLRIISAVAAAYAFFAYLLEWIHEVWPFWREQDGQLRTLSEGVEGISKQTSEPIKKHERTFTESREALIEAGRTLKIFAERGYIGTTPIVETFDGLFSEEQVEKITNMTYLRLPDPQGHGPRYTPQQKQDAEIMTIIQIAVRRTLLEVTERARVSSISAHNSEVDQIGELLTRARASLENLGSDVPAIDLRPLGRLRWTLRGRRSSLVARVWLIALGTPAFLFAAGFLRFIMLLLHG